MPVYSLNQAKTHLSALLESVEKGEEITITRYGKAVAKIVAVRKPERIQLGFHPVNMQSDFMEPTDEETVQLFLG
jgi:prevent-host-death family protein